MCSLMLTSVLGCKSQGSQPAVVDAVDMESADLFRPVDTVRFDATVIVGIMRFVDVSDSGDFLITDGVAEAFHVFTASGNHIRTFSAKLCNPEDRGFGLSARFMSDGSMIAVTSSGIYAFNTDGTCKKRLLDLPTNRPSFCEWQGSVYFLDEALHIPKIYAYSLESGVVRDYDLRKPRFPRVTAVKGGWIGRQLACFDDGVYYRFPESSDGEPLWPGNAPVTHRPTFYRAPQRDVIETNSGGARMDDLMELAREATYSSGLYKLDENHRLVTFEALPPRIPLSIVNTKTQTSVSAVTDLPFKLAKHGFLYVLGDHEPLPAGDVGNRMLERWQFTSFDALNDEVPQ